MAIRTVALLIILGRLSCAAQHRLKKLGDLVELKSAMHPLNENWACFKQSCYKLVENNYTDIEDCRKDCMLEGGDLASIHDNEENNFIQTLQKDNLVWFGGRINEKDGEFRWIDGSDWDFDNWDINEPDRKIFGKHLYECTFLAIEGQQGR